MLSAIYKQLFGKLVADTPYRMKVFWIPAVFFKIFTKVKDEVISLKNVLEFKDDENQHYPHYS